MQPNKANPQPIQQPIDGTYEARIIHLSRPFSENISNIYKIFKNKFSCYKKITEAHGNAPEVKYI